MIYPGSVPEFRILEKVDGTTVMQVKYINTHMGYTGKWMDVKMEKENDTNSQPNTPSYV